MEAWGLLGVGLTLPSGVTSFHWDWAYVWNALPSLLKMVPVTLELAVCGIFFGTVIGLLIALMKISPYSVLKYLGSVYTWIFRGIPLLVQLFIIFFGVSLAFKIYLPPKVAAIIGISLCGGAYIAEIIRAGIQSIDKGQMEAAVSLGMTKAQAMRRIILPQTYRRLLPPMGNEFISLLKDTSLASTITVTEVLRTAQLMAGTSLRPLELYVCAGVIFLLLNTVFTVVFGMLENKLAKAE